MGFSAMEVDQSLYIFRSSKNIIAIWVHVDNSVVISNSVTVMSDFKCQLCSKVDIKWQDTISQIVGLECMCGKGEVVIAQKRLTESILAAYPQQVVKKDSPPGVAPTFLCYKGGCIGSDSVPFGCWLTCLPC
ncbi:hypothetical protein O181_049717 [Austropuccinia psidii MF-1]|uniref:Uncharacterized protein n=1 Tax=Austropuccinia psidii MF-1 TaxID=1389203 RepID=A0A9Q3E2B0_9BASI|nr:hypothetical protein [Austropuccinia psidii MF-1]